MDIRVQASGVSCTPAMVAHVRQSLRHGLSHRSGSVDHVVVRLGGGGRTHDGEHDTYCLMQVHLSGASAATVVDMGTDMQATIARAAERMGRLAGAKLEAAKARPAGGPAS
jgi:hypothetical protein